MKYVAIGYNQNDYEINGIQLCGGDSIEEVEAKLINDGFKKGKDRIFRGWYFVEGCYNEDGYLEPFCYDHYVEVSIENTRDL